MIEASNIVLWVNISFISLSLFIFLFFYLKGFISSLYDLIAFGIIIVSLTPLSSWLSSLIPLFSAQAMENGLFGLIVDRFANQAIWSMIVYFVLSLIFLLIKRPIIKNFPLKLDKKVDKGLSLILSGLGIFLVGTLMSGLFLSPIFANGNEIVENSVLTVFRASGQQLVDTVSDEFKDFNIVSKLLSGESLQLDDQQAIIDLFVSFKLPTDVATTLSKFALELEVTQDERNALVTYAQTQGFTIEDLRKLLEEIGLSEALINEFLDDFK